MNKEKKMEKLAKIGKIISKVGKRTGQQTWAFLPSEEKKGKIVIDLYFFAVKYAAYLTDDEKTFLKSTKVAKKDFPLFVSCCLRASIE